MRKRAQTLLPRLCRAFNTSSAPCDATSQGPAASFPSWLVGSGASTRVSTPLTKALPGSSQRNGYAVPLQAPPTEVTTLANGVRIVSEASTVGGAAALLCCFRCCRVATASQGEISAAARHHPHHQGPISSLGLYVNSGSIYETPETTGAMCFLDWGGPSRCLAAANSKQQGSWRFCPHPLTPTRLISQAHLPC